MTPSEIIRSAIDQYQPSHVFALFSGGHDSLTSTHASMATGLVNAVVHINTGIGIEQTREFVRDTCKREGWELIERHPPNKTYFDFVMKFGFPGPYAHRYAYVWLKERALKGILRDFKVDKKPIVLLTGVRRQESTRRMGHVETVRKDGRTIWVAPIADWTKRDCGDYISEHKLPRNEVVDLLHMSGECLCGAFAHPGEISEIEQWFPQTAGYIHQLEGIAEKYGVHCVWGTPPPSHFAEAKRGQKYLIPPTGPLCTSCDKRFYDEEDVA